MAEGRIPFGALIGKLQEQEHMVLEGAFLTAAQHFLESMIG